MHASVDSLCVCSMALGCELATPVIIIASVVCRAGEDTPAQIVDAPQ